MSGGRMKARDRRALILRELSRNSNFSVSQFASELNISGMTVRRDLAAMEEQGLLHRTHGGAVLGPTKPVSKQRLRLTGTANASINGGPVKVSPTIALVMPSARYYFPTVIRGAETAARDLGARLVLAVSNYSAAEEEHQIRRLLTRGVDGLIVTFSGEQLHGSGTAALLATANIPVVIAERSIESVRDELDLESVRSDHVRGAEIAIKHLLSLGHTRIALGARLNSPTFSGVRTGYRLSMQEAGAVPGDSLECTFSAPSEAPDALRAEMATMLEEMLASGCTAVLLLNDEDALTFVDCCQARNVRIPQDIAIVAYDDELASMGSVPLTAVAPPKHDVGYQAVSMCLERLSQAGTGPVSLRQTTLTPSLVIRESSGVD